VQRELGSVTAAPSATATGAWRDVGVRWCLETAREYNFLKTRGVSYLDACSEPAHDTTFIQVKEILSL
jgi:hypothetical protein